MRVLVLHAHPEPASFSAALFALAVETLRHAGHAVEAVDLYAEGFDPVLGRGEWSGYVAVPANRVPVAREVDRVLAAEAIVFVAPVWNFGFPAILKGYLDRVFLPGVTFNLTGGRISPGMTHVRRLVCITTYGSPRWWAIVVGDAPRRLIGRVLRALIHPRGRSVFLAHYCISASTDASRKAFVERVRRSLERL